MLTAPVVSSVVNGNDSYCKKKRRVTVDMNTIRNLQLGNTSGNDRNKLSDRYELGL
jgi:3-hydroxyisobutyrate dehydrogenase-like beta-hydroxyacid dehydrogenase